MTVLYEIKKIFMKPVSFLAVIIFIVLKIISLTAIHSNIYINNLMEENRREFLSYMDVLSGELTDEKENFILQEESRLANIDSDCRKMQEKYINGEIDELTFVDYIDQYNQDVKKKNAFSVIQGQYQLMLQNGKNYFSYYNGWAFLYGNGTEDWLLILLVFLIAVPAVSSEYTSGMADLLDTTEKGKTKFYISKFVAVIIFTVLATAVFLFSEFIYAYLKYGLSDGNYPIQTIPQFSASEFDITLSEGIFFVWFNRIFGMCFLTSILFFCVRRTKKSLPALFVGMTVILLPKILLNNSSLFYKLPLPSTLLNSAGFLRSSFESSYMSDKYITLDIENYMKTAILSAIFFIILMIFGVTSLKFRKIKFLTLFLCISLILSGCGNNRNFSSNIIVNQHGKYEIVENSKYIFQNNHSELLMIDKTNDEQVEIVRNPFNDDTTTTLCDTMFADENYFYRHERVSSSSINGQTISTEQILRTDLTNFNEDVIYSNDIFTDTRGAYLGVGEYLPDVEQTDADISSFIVDNETLFLEMKDGIYTCQLSKNKLKKIIDNTIIKGEWSYTGDIIYYIDELYRLHKFLIESGSDEIIGEKRVSGLFVTDDSIYLRSLSNNGALMRYSVSDENYETVVDKTGDCFAVFDNNIYYTDPENDGRLCKINLSSSEKTVISKSNCSFVYPISNYGYIYYSAYDEKSGTYDLYKYPI